MNADLAKLVELQKTDSRIRQLKKNIETADERRAAIEQEFEEHASSIREIQNRKKEASDTKAHIEAGIAEAKTSLERANRNLTTAKDQKQYEAAMREIDTLNKQISKGETDALETMETIDEVDGVLNERAEEIASLDSDWKTKLADFEAELESKKRELAELTGSRGHVFEVVSPRLASVYNRLIDRSRDGIAVAEVTDGACSACFMALRKQMIVQLRTTPEIITCESCTRILYIPEDLEQGVAGGEA